MYITYILQILHMLHVLHIVRLGQNPMYSFPQEPSIREVPSLPLDATWTATVWTHSEFTACVYIYILCISMYLFAYVCIDSFIFIHSFVYL